MAAISAGQDELLEKRYGRSAREFRGTPSSAARHGLPARRIALGSSARTLLAGPFLFSILCSCWAVFVPALAAAAGAAVGDPIPADLVLRNGAIYTVDATRSWAQSLAVRGDRIVSVGTDRDAAAFVGPKTQVVDLGGRFVVPGFHDRHVHPVSGGMELASCDLNGSADRSVVLSRVRACVAGLGDKPWLVGGGWDLPLFPGGVADRRDLDAILDHRPALLSSADGHSVWVNSRALELAGIGAATPDPPDGRIERDASGAPVGTLREGAADLVTRLLPDATAAERLAGLRLAVDKAHGFGIVAMTEASAGAETLAAYDALDDQGDLGLRVVVSQLLSADQGVNGIPALLARRAARHAPHVRATAIKLFADGVLEGGTAALLEPYVGGRTGTGIANWTPAALSEVVVALDREQFQIHVHAIGDRAIRETLDALQAARAANGARDARPLLAHIQLFSPVDIPRFRELGVIADFQPLWAIEDAYIRDLTVPFLGPARSRWLYPMASMARTGAVLAAGSDWSVTSMNPLEAIEVAITRCDPALSTCDRPWIPEERVDLATMLAAYTIGGAYAGFEERASGSLEAGKLADLIVLDRNLFSIPPGEISEAKVLLTLFEGRAVFGTWDALKNEAASKGGS
jgi:predicted amidohydrolase YtcJ